MMNEVDVYIRRVVANSLTIYFGIPNSVVLAFVLPANLDINQLHWVIVGKINELMSYYYYSQEITGLSELQIYLDMDLMDDAAACVSAMTNEFIQALSKQALYQILTRVFKSNQSDLILQLWEKLSSVGVNLKAPLQHNGYYAVHTALCHCDIETLNQLEIRFRAVGIEITDVLSDDETLSEIFRQKTIEVIDWSWSKVGDDVTKKSFLETGEIDYEFIIECCRGISVEKLEFLFNEAERLGINMDHLFSSGHYTVLEALCSNDHFNDLPAVKQFLLSHGVDVVRFETALLSETGLEALWSSFDSGNIHMVKSVWYALIEEGLHPASILMDSNAGFFRLVAGSTNDDFLAWARGLYQTYTDVEDIIPLLRQSCVGQDNADEAAQHLVEKFLDSSSKDCSVVQTPTYPHRIFQFQPQPQPQSQLQFQPPLSPDELVEPGFASENTQVEQFEMTI